MKMFFATLVLFFLLLPSMAKSKEISPESQIPPYMGISDHYRWNQDKQCYDESWNGGYAVVPKNESLSYDPDWTEAVENADGCLFYFHPTQGQENISLEFKPSKELPRTGGV